ncbi:endoplasmic reticulum-Golgi intermediate compartment protein 3-like [Histomonas meleagridis]|uniref:endoplasmic reticulum-Golgi intermediate compartment protein 3-like n=1 Tax=Histomonas meleagridis TaxID=135588 RepID=UPI00355A58C5|nr:endoplasmic reticulum-Golgi intermediate compartment protein 3-like [Histomonas meleagridis]KAH0799090.1 endoplasmic reticulum-Golgi intermediate compartment protein 3-like [Histomonas meleagridis]
MGPNTVSLRRLNKFGKFIGISNHSLADECVEDQLDIISFLMGKRPKPKTDCLDRIKLGISPDEKCLIKGKITVNKVRGIFHIAPGKNSDRVGSHIHDLSGRIPHFDLSHKIERIRFGPKIPTTYQPLEGVRLVQRSRLPIHYHYYVMATPVTYIKNGEIKDHGFDCTVIPSSTVSLPGMGNAPGLYFDYQFTPYTVVVRAESKRFFTYIAYTFAVLSGAFVITDLLSSYIWEEEDCEELLDDKIDK